MSIEAMRQALEALEFLELEIFVELDKSLNIGPSYGRKAIVALRTAIKEAEKQEPDMRHPKVQAIIGARARLQIELRLIEQLLDDPDFETTASDMEYWGPLHDRLKERLAPRQWQGLTDEEILKAVGWETAEMYMKLTPNFPVEEARKETVKNARAIEAKLKELNT